jgi:hypothetical protein
MLIVADGADVRDLVPDDDRVRLIHLAGSIEIGDKRNFGCEQSRGEIICHWDDDDWSGISRLGAQVEMLLSSSGKSVSGFHSMRFTDGSRWWQYSGFAGYALGTSLCYRKDWWSKNRFPSLQISEDKHFTDIAKAQSALIAVDAGDLMYATIHAENTSPRVLTGSNWRQIA